MRTRSHILFISSISVLILLILFVKDSQKPTNLTRISYEDVTVDVTPNSTSARASISCVKATKLVVVNKVARSFLYCTPEDGNIILRSDEVDSILVLGEPLGAYIELDIKEPL